MMPPKCSWFEDVFFYFYFFTDFGLLTSVAVRGISGLLVLRSSLSAFLFFKNVPHCGFGHSYGKLSIVYCFGRSVLL